VILLHLPGGRHTADAVRDALVPAMAHLPAQLRRSLAWDQGKEMALHGQIALALDMPVFFSRQGQPLAAAQQREHQRAAAPVLPDLYENSGLVVGLAARSVP
jgi:IS30 family transposase